LTSNEARGFGIVHPSEMIPGSGGDYIQAPIACSSFD
jgi:hypothetical protein